MIDKDTAAAIARSYLSILRVPTGVELAIAADKIVEKAFGWVFFYNSKKFLETGEYQYAAVGNAPLIIDGRDASLHVTGTARASKIYIEQYERRSGFKNLEGRAKTGGKDSSAARADHRGFTAEQRRVLLDEWFSLQQRLSELGNLLPGGYGDAAQMLMDEEKAACRRCSELITEYMAGLPVIAVSSCPFTGIVMHQSVDHFGLDGLWWNYRAACRPVEQLPETYFALTGALRLAGPPTQFPFLCRPGPEIPYVVPRMLRHPAVKAVLSTGSIGEHQGYAITYFAKPIPDIPRINTWGAHCYKFIDEKGQTRLGSEPDNPSELDFDLAPWIANGKLLWIAPGDTTLTLRDTVSGCPYLGLEGRRQITYIRNGRVWW